VGVGVHLRVAGTHVLAFVISGERHALLILWMKGHAIFYIMNDVTRHINIRNETRRHLNVK
jgi:hypothetical protein